MLPSVNMLAGLGQVSEAGAAARLLRRRAGLAGLAESCGGEGWRCAARAGVRRPGLGEAGGAAGNMPEALGTLPSGVRPCSFSQDSWERLSQWVAGAQQVCVAAG